MKIFVNGDIIETDATSLAELVAAYPGACKAVATAVDGTFIARDQRAAFIIQPDMRVEILSPMQGG